MKARSLANSQGQNGMWPCHSSVGILPEEYGLRQPYIDFEQKHSLYWYKWMDIASKMAFVRFKRCLIGQKKRRNGMCWWEYRASSSGRGLRNPQMSQLCFYLWFVLLFPRCICKRVGLGLRVFLDINGTDAWHVRYGSDWYERLRDEKSKRRMSGGRFNPIVCLESSEMQSEHEWVCHGSAAEDKIWKSQKPMRFMGGSNCYYTFGEVIIGVPIPLRASASLPLSWQLKTTKMCGSIMTGSPSNIAFKEVGGGDEYAAEQVN